MFDKGGTQLNSVAKGRVGSVRWGYLKEDKINYSKVVGRYTASNFW